MKGKNQDESDDILKLLGKKKESLARQLLGSDDDDDDDNSASEKEKETTIKLSDHSDSEQGDEEEESIFKTAFRKAEIMTVKKTKSSSSSSSSSGSDSDLNVDMDDDYDENGYGDEADTQRLMALPEIEREAILFERFSHRQRRRERVELKRKLRAERSNRLHEVSAPTRSGLKRDIKSSQATSASSIIDPYKRKLEKARSHDYEEGQDEEEKEDEEVEEGDEYDDDDDRDGYRDHDYHGKRKSFATSTLEKEEVPLESVLAMQVTRNMISKWVYRSFFRTELQGAFFRLSMKNKSYQAYRVDEVIEYGRKYTVEKLFTTTLGFSFMDAGTKKRTSFENISNGPISQLEYNEWLERSKKASTSTHRKQLVLGMREAGATIKRLRTLDSKPMSESEIDYIINEKKKVNAFKRNLTLEKAYLLRSRDEARIANDINEAERIEAEIQKLDTEADSIEGKDKRVTQLEQINKKNKEMNIVLAREAELESRKMKAIKGDESLNPFARRKTRSTFADYVMTKKPTVTSTSPAAPSPAPPSIGTLSTVTASDLSSQAAMLSQTLPEKLIPKESRHDLFELHSHIDLDIDIDIPDNLASSNPKKIKAPSMATAPTLSGLQKYKKEHGLF